jgi:hypothetical protein
MATFKNLVLFALLGAVAGFAVASWVTPGILTWNNTPGLGQALCNCTESTRNTAAALIHYQLVGMGLGAVAAAVGGGVILRRRGQTAKAKATKSETPPPPPGAA